MPLFVFGRIFFFVRTFTFENETRRLFVFIGEEVYLGVTNIGTRPSVDDREEITVETLILDFERDVYGEEITLELHAFLRPTLRFESLKAVQCQVEKDSLRVRELFS